MEQFIPQLQNESPEKVLLWKHPKETFCPGDALLVPPGQQALFFAGQQLLDVLQPGRHLINPLTAPALSARISGGQCRCSLYFADVQLCFMQLWGGSMDYHAPGSPGLCFPLGIRGSVLLQAAHPQKLVQNIAFSMKTFSEEEHRSVLRGKLRDLVTGCVSGLIAEKQLEVHQIQSALDELARESLEKLQPAFDALGLRADRLVIESISPRAGDMKYKQYNDILLRGRLENTLSYEDALRGRAVTAAPARKAAVQGRFCSGCGRKLPDGARCRRCGAHPPKVKYCTHCGVKAAGTAKCRGCAAVI